MCPSEKELKPSFAELRCLTGLRFVLALACLAADFILIPLGFCLGLFLGLVVLIDLGLKVFQMNVCELGFGKLVSGILKGLVSHCLAAGNENVGFRAAKLVSRACVPLPGRNRPPKNPATGNENLGLGLAKLFQGVFRDLRPLIWPQPAAKNPGAWAGKIVLKSFQGLASPYLAQPAAKKSSHRRWESGAWAGKIVLRSFQGLASPYLAAAGHQKSSHRKWEPEPAKTFRDSRRGIFHYLGLQAEELWAKIRHGFPCFVDCENWEEQLSNFWRTTKN